MPVHLEVRFASALEFVTEYAENLSSGGLYLRTERPLEPLSELELELALPGIAAVARIRVRVAHVVTPELAARLGRAPGAGCEIIASPRGFDDALRAYLARLGRRRDHAVWCHDDEPRAFFERMGYLTRALPGMGELTAELAHSEARVQAVVVPPEAERLYRTTLARVGAEDLVRVVAPAGPFDALLIELDASL